MTDFFQDLIQNVEHALIEDIRQGDLTAQLIAPETQTHAIVISRQDAVICGRPWFDEVFKQLDDQVIVQWHIQEGDKVSANTKLCELKGNARAILTGERAALNFLQTLSATATTTADYVAHLNNSKTQLLDTRKTLPGLRLAQKYAVKCGGGQNHRIGLYDAILIKENHIIACGGIDKAVRQAKAFKVPIEVETENLEEVQMAIDAGADIIMLDNFALADIQKAVEMVAKRAKLEVSGNVEIAGLKTLAATGVDYISTGAITKHLKAIDLSMRFEFLT